MLQNSTFWLKSEIFETCILPHKPTSKINVANLTRIFAYSIKSELDQFSHWSWLKIACDKIKMSLPLAMLYFDVTWDFFASVEQRKHFNENKVNRSVNDNKSDNTEYGASDERSVSVHNLILVLFLQLFAIDPGSLKRCRSLERVSNQEKWPSPNRSTTSPTIFSLTSREKILDDDIYVQFIKDKIEDLSKVFGDAFGKVLEVIIAVKNNQDESLSWGDLIKNFSKDDICQTLKTRLVPNLFGVKTCIKSGKRLSWPVGRFGSEDNSQDKPKMATNAHKTDQHKLIVINQLTNKTVARKSATLTQSHVKIHRCKQSFIYLMTSLRSLSITKCSDTTIVTGPIRNNLNINRCTNVRVISVANRVIIGETFNSLLHIATPNEIIFNGETCRNVTLAPFNTNYANLEDDLEKVGMLKIPTSVWKKPIVLTKSEIKTNCRAAFPFKIMRPELFSAFVVPFKGLNVNNIMFDLEDEYKQNVNNIMFDLEDEYKQNVDKQSQATKHWDNLKLEAKLDSEQAIELEKHLELKFNEWMAKSTSELAALNSLLSILE